MLFFLESSNLFISFTNDLTTSNWLAASEYTSRKTAEQGSTNIYINNHSSTLLSKANNQSPVAIIYIYHKLTFHFRNGPVQMFAWLNILFNQINKKLFQRFIVVQWISQIYQGTRINLLNKRYITYNLVTNVSICWGSSNVKLLKLHLKIVIQFRKYFVTDSIL